jgi:DNA repair protein RadC
MEKIDLSEITFVKLKYHNKVKPSDRQKVNRSQDAYEIFIENWDWETITHIETMKLMLLNRANKVLGIADLSTGGTNGCIIDLKVIFQYAILANASFIILAHNHPSGSLKPSEADIAITKKVKDAGKFLDITLLDHLIISPDERYFSLADEGCF